MNKVTKKINYTIDYKVKEFIDNKEKNLLRPNSSYNNLRKFDEELLSAVIGRKYGGNKKK